MLEINIYSYNLILVIEPKGYLNTEHASDFRRWFEDQIEHGSIFIAIDLLDVEYISSMGISTLLDLHSLIQRAGGHLVFFNANREVESIFNFLKLNQKMSFLLNSEDAIHALLEYKKNRPALSGATNIESSEVDSHVANESDASDQALFLEEECGQEDEMQQLNEPTESNELNESKEPLLKDSEEKLSIPNDKKVNQEFEVLDCPNCKKKMKVRGGGQFMCPHCQNSVIFVEDVKMTNHANK